MKSEKTLIKRFTPLIIILVLLVMMAAIITPTVAYYIRTTGEVESEYTPAEPTDPSFQLDFKNNKMENVVIEVKKDEGYPIYVRVAILVTWQKPGECDNSACKGTDCSNCTMCMESEDELEFMNCPKCNPDVYFANPEDYTMDLGDEWEKWTDNFYYCKSPIVSGGKTPLEVMETPVLLKSFELANAETPDEDYVLNVEIIVQTVQAIGSTDRDDDIPAWRDAWTTAPSLKSVED